MHMPIFLFKQSILLSGLLLLACSNSPAPSPLDTVTVEPATAVASGPAPKQDLNLREKATADTPKPIVAKAKPVFKNTVKAEMPAPEPMRDTAPVITAKPESPAPGPHDSWNALLGKYVDAATGKVNYKGFKTDKATLDAYLQSLAANTPTDTWSRAEKMAYWINAYNAFTIDLILDNYPVSSILNLDGGKTWDVKRITLGGKNYSLNQIENEILRPQFKDPRVHFALNCAAKSCPPLYNKAFTAETLERALEQRTRQFINDPKFNGYTAEKASVSKIFEWYAADFGDLKAFLNKFAAVKLNDSASISFQEYNWDLNG